MEDLSRAHEKNHSRLSGFHLSLKIGVSQAPNYNITQFNEPLDEGYCWETSRFDGEKRGYLLVNYLS